MRFLVPRRRCRESKQPACLCQVQSQACDVGDAVQPFNRRINQSKTRNHRSQTFIGQNDHHAPSQKRAWLCEQTRRRRPKQPSRVDVDTSQSRRADVWPTRTPRHAFLRLAENNFYFGESTRGARKVAILKRLKAALKVVADMAEWRGR